MREIVEYELFKKDQPIDNKSLFEDTFYHDDADALTDLGSYDDSIRDIDDLIAPNTPLHLEYFGQPLGDRHNLYIHMRQNWLNAYPDTDKRIIYPVDLYKIRQWEQATPNNRPNKIKQWFFNGLHMHADLQLTTQTPDEAEREIIEQQIRDIQNKFSGPAQISLEEIENLRLALLALFKQPWMGIAKKMVDENQLFIDTLITLTLWQAGQYAATKKNKNGFLLKKVTKDEPLKVDHEIEYCPENNEHLQLIDCLVVHIKRPRRKEIDRLTLTKVGENSSYHQIPSANLFDRMLLENQKCYLLPIYATGLFTGEDFIAITYLGGRLQQLYTPGATGNLSIAHGIDQGEIANQHDWLHCLVDYPEFSQQGPKVFKQRMEMIAIIANSYARMCQQLDESDENIEKYSRNAHLLLDQQDEVIAIILSVSGNNQKDKIASNEKLFAYLLAEMIYIATGVYPDISIIETNSEEISGTYSRKYNAKVTYANGVPDAIISLTITADIGTTVFLDELQKTFDKIVNDNQKTCTSEMLAHQWMRSPSPSPANEQSDDDLTIGEKKRFHFFVN